MEECGGVPRHWRGVDYRYCILCSRPVFYAPLIDETPRLALAGTLLVAAAGIVTITAPDVYYAPAYYHDHPEEMRAAKEHRGFAG
jgi:hypothetical protein